MIQTTLTQASNTHLRHGTETWSPEESPSDRVQVFAFGGTTDKFVNHLPGNCLFDDNTSTRPSLSLLVSSTGTYEYWVNAVHLIEDPQDASRVPLRSGRFHYVQHSPSQLYPTLSVFQPGLVDNSALDSLDIPPQLANLKNLEDGWADGIQLANQWSKGYGKAPDHSGLDWLAANFASRYATGLPLPYIYPTPEGGVSLEWSLGMHRVSLEIDLDTYQAEWHCLDLLTDEFKEWDLRLDISQSWEWLVSEIRRLGTPET